MASRDTRRARSAPRRLLLLLCLAALTALTAGAAVSSGGDRRASPALSPHAGPPKPRIVWRPIPFGKARREEMRAYSRRHYGIDEWRLIRPRVIVQHYTVSSTFSSAYNTFAADVPDGELHELPGVCAHFVVDRDGTIYQLVNLKTMCRHTVGLNYTSIGIEHVGFSDREILGNPKQLKASLALSVWLMARYGIHLGNVIGHNESRESRYHKELYAGWRCQTHGDWTRADMEIYRASLKRLAKKHGVAIGPRVRPRDSGC